MKGRESGMPDSARWNEFFDPEKVIESLGCANVAGDIVEFGCGYGTFTLPVALRVSGTVHAMDIDSEMVASVVRSATGARLTNISAVKRDFMADGTGLPAASAVHAMVFNILHIEEPLRILREAYRVLEPGGKLSIIHWRTDMETPRGPSPDIRPSREHCAAWAKQAGFADGRSIPLGAGAPWHYGLVFEKPV